MPASSPPGLKSSIEYFAMSVGNGLTPHMYQLVSCPISGRLVLPYKWGQPGLRHILLTQLYSPAARTANAICESDGAIEGFCRKPYVLRPRFPIPERLMPGQPRWCGSFTNRPDSSHIRETGRESVDPVQVSHARSQGQILELSRPDGGRTDQPRGTGLRHLFTAA